MVLRQNRVKLVKRPKAGGLEIVANGRDDWIGCAGASTPLLARIIRLTTGLRVKLRRSSIPRLVQPAFLARPHLTPGSQDSLSDFERHWLRR